MVKDIIQKFIYHKGVEEYKKTQVRLKGVFCLERSPSKSSNSSLRPFRSLIVMEGLLISPFPVFMTMSRVTPRHQDIFMKDRHSYHYSQGLMTLFDPFIPPFVTVGKREGLKV